MRKCTNEKECAFAHCDDRYKSLPSMALYETKYCKGQSNECIRLKLTEKFGSLRVPSNMMPNGLPLPGTHRRDWSEVALKYPRYLENRDF
ncbi:hypothetical protein EZV73_18220 [Acidaminobacter sp. JC074]|uniref:hypothetical protein n=1 Tax=Acidaminobacter sp. JC074 TaxID=2530199 RepID=UPI001F115221|nr:hypothetical protein [Acidaminobacter sp. JC074]MCH4889523.1 hypothetical protein [Acidaminobacter sp. JC074]